MAMAAALALSMCMPARAMADTCCDDSEPGCNAGQKTGTSCGGNNVCVAITDKCTKKKPKFEGVDCSCTTNNSKLEVPELLDFSTLNLSANPSETKNFKVKNGGGVPFNVTYCITAGTDFSAESPSGQGAAIAQLVGAEASPPAPICTGRMKSAMVPEFGFTNVPVKFDRQLPGASTGNIYFDSTAALNPSANVSLIGKATGALSFGLRPPPLSIASSGGSVELACNKLDIGLVYLFEPSSNSSMVMSSFSTNKTTFSKPAPLFGNGHLLSNLLLTRALTGNGFLVGYTDLGTTPESVWTFSWTPGQPPGTPTEVGSGILSSLNAGGNMYWIGINALSPSITAEYLNSNDAMTWNPLSAPVGTNFTSDANFVYAWGGKAWALWTDSGTTLGSPINRYASLYDGTAFRAPILFHAFPAGATAAYFSPNTSFSGGTVLDPGSWSPDGSTTPFTSFVDYLSPGASAPKDQQIGGTGYEAPFPQLYNNSFLAGIVNNVSGGDILTGFYGELGGTLKYVPTKLKLTVEARYFSLGKTRYDAFSTDVQKSDPGPVFLDHWSVR